MFTPSRWSFFLLSTHKAHTFARPDTFCNVWNSIIDVRSFRGADCDTDHYLVVAKVRERLAVRKQAAQNSDGVRFNLRKLNDLEVRKQYQIEITNKFAALKNACEDEDINRGWENIKENIKT